MLVGFAANHFKHEFFLDRLLRLSTFASLLPTMRFDKLSPPRSLQLLLRKHRTTAMAHDEKSDPIADDLTPTVGAATDIAPLGHPATKPPRCFVLPYWLKGATTAVLSRFEPAEFLNAI